MTQATRQVQLSAPWLDERDEELVLETLRSGWLSLGPTGPRFEDLLAEAAGALEHKEGKPAIAGDQTDAGHLKSKRIDARRGIPESLSSG